MAVTTAAVIGAGAAVSGAVESRRAGRIAEQQGEQQARAQDQSIAESRRQFDLTRQDLLEAQQFSREQQEPALRAQRALIGLEGPEAQQEAISSLQESPGQQFLRRRQERALLRNAAAIGGLGGGNVRTALQEQAAGFAQQDLENQFRRLGTVAAGGRAIGQQELGTAGQIGQFGAQNVRDVSAGRQAASEARASGVFGRQQARAQGAQQLFQGAGQFISALNRPSPQGDFSGAFRPTVQNQPLAGPFRPGGQF